MLKRIPDAQPWKKNAFIIGASLFYILGLFDLWDGLRTLLYSAAGTYVIAYYVDGSLMPWIGFIFLMGHMSISHIYRQILDDAQVVDITGAQMVLVMKLTSFCWNIHDGRLPQDQLSDSQKYSAINEFPSIANYAGYVLFFPSLFAGPSFEYVDYRRWLDTSLFEIPPGTDPSKVPPIKKKRKIPRSGTPALKKAIVGLGWIFLFLQLGSRYTTDLVLSDSFMDYAFPRRIWIVYMLGFTTRLKYYGVWSLTEGACILSGMGYNGFDGKSGKVFWNRLENVDPWSLETAQNSHAYLGSWNKNTNHWLRNYIYLRVTPKGKKPGFRASMATFATSALWHGFYPGYYMTFVLGSFIQTAAKSMFSFPATPFIRILMPSSDFRRHVRPFFLTPDGSKPTPYKRYYDILSWLATQLTLAFTTLPFVLLSFGDSMTAWSHVYFYGIVVTFSSIVFFASPRKGLPDRPAEAPQPTPFDSVYQHRFYPADDSGSA